eukprot:gb/GEZJ01000595.1/.p1 GENE.gb/GEZJ01000595.1/~~gb/GEZJ01000595.1/.p1  ORF type:complete len:370 (-),score=37.03 gb/GEZJ01000595.1/:420-1529(-)
MSRGDHGQLYVLIVKDDLSGYVWLKATSEAEAETTTAVLLDWFSSFGIPKSWVSDKGSYFKNKLMNLIADALKSKHHFTLPYCPWSNGSVEVVCRELLRTCRAVLSEFQLSRSAWPSVLPLVQSALNNSSTRRLNRRCTLTVFTGLPKDTPLLAIVRDGTVKSVKSVDEAKKKALLDAEQVQKAMLKLHRECAERSAKQRKSAVDSNNRRTGIRPINFSEGDFVLRGLLQNHTRSKLKLKWHGPFRVTLCRDNYVLEMKDLLTGKKDWVHGRRLMFCRNKIFALAQEIEDHLPYQANELLTVQEFTDIQQKHGNIQLLVKWKGFSESETGWVNLASLIMDVPELVREYLEEVKNSGTKRQSRISRTIEM